MSFRPSPAVMDMVSRLIAFDTTSRFSNLDLIEDVRMFLAEHGIEAQLVFDADGRKANLFATIGPKDRPGIMLSGHTDVVPVDGQAWSSDPFRVEEREGRLFGRGTCDMKGFVATVLAKVPDMVRAPLAMPVHLALSYDEEIGCIGVRRLIDVLRDAPIKPRCCIVGEPTEMKVVLAHKGKFSERVRVRGLEAHSSRTHEAVNAVEAAAEIIAELKRMARDKRDNGPFDGDFEPPYTTIHTGIVRGGTQLNIVPGECIFDWEARYLPTDDPDAIRTAIRTFADSKILPEMRAVSPQAGIEWIEIASVVGLDMRDDAEVVALVKSLTGANATHKVSFGTEAGLFQEVGIPTVVCGPGSIAQAHKPDEYIELEQLHQCEAFMDRLIARASAG